MKKTLIAAAVAGMALLSSNTQAQAVPEAISYSKCL